MCFRGKTGGLEYGPENLTHRILISVVVAAVVENVRCIPSVVSLIESLFKVCWLRR